MKIRQGEEVGQREDTSTGGYGRSNGMGIIVSEEISKQVIRVERWEGWMVMAWVMIEANGVLCWYMGHKREGLRQGSRNSGMHWRGWWEWLSWT